MLRKLLKYIIVATAPLLVGCSDDFNEEASNAKGVLSITLRSNSSTRADSDTNDSQYNEDKIDNVVFAFYPNEYEDETAALAVFKPSEISLSVTNASYTAEINLAPDIIETLFNDESDSSCKFFAIANLTTDEIATITGNPTILQLRNLSISSEFASKKQQESFVMSGTGTVTYTKNNERDKSASGSATLTRTAAKISLSITIDDSVTDSEGNKWTPVTTSGNLRVLLNNGVSASTLNSNGIQEYNTYYNITAGQSAVYRSLSNSNNTGTYTMDVPLYTYPNTWNNTSIEEEHRTTMTLVMTWQRGTSTFRTFYYKVPVTPNESLVSNYSYQVNLSVGMLGSLTPDTPVEIEDVSYQVVDWGTANVDVDLKDTRYLIVNPYEYDINNEASFRIPFYSSHDVEISNISIAFQRFNFYNNTEGKVANFTLTKSVIDNTNNKADADNKFCTYDIEYETKTKQYYIVINHPLKIWNPYDKSDIEIPLTGNETEVKPADVSSSISYMKATTDDSFAPYTIKVTLRHKDNHNFVDSAQIVQYPAMYITPKANPGGSYNSRINSNIAGTTNGGSTSVNSPSVQTYYYGFLNYGYTYVNPTTMTISSQRGIDPDTEWIVNDERLGGLKLTTPKNENMYVVTTTQLNDSIYIIGDPRSTVIDNNLSTDVDGTKRSDEADGTWCNPATALYESGTDGRRLKYYYPTLETSATEKMISPKFRIASQYGQVGSVTKQLTKEQARKRLATYQEQGYPAGRWRLPTKAELAYMVYLQKKNYIPRLFMVSGEGYGYMTAQGSYIINEDGTISEASQKDKSYVRGIYDEWYWDLQKDYVLNPTNEGVYNYTFGDVPRK